MNRANSLVVIMLVLFGLLATQVQVTAQNVERETAWHVNDIKQMGVIDQQGNYLGQVKDMIVDKKGEMNYLILSSQDGKLIPVPWKAADMEMWKDRLVLGFNQDKIKNAPSFSANDMPKFDQTYEQRVLSYYGQ